MRISQEFPGFADSHRGSAFIVIDNLTNLINDDWGVMYKANFPYGVTQDDIDAGRAETRIGNASLWEIRVGSTTASKWYRYKDKAPSGAFFSAPVWLGRKAY